MVQLNFLSGKKAGSQTVVRHFPFHIGRGAHNELQLDDPGIWDSHLTLELHLKNRRFAVVIAPNALAALNDQPVESAPLRNGDIISVGSVKMQFWLTAVKQRGLRLRELFVWVLLILVVVSQFVLIYWCIE